jgi:TPR repeat protein
MERPLRAAFPVFLLALGACGRSGVAREALEAQGISVAGLERASEEGTFAFTGTRGDEECSGSVEVRPGDDAASARVDLECLPPPGAQTLALPAEASLALRASARRCDGGQGDACAALGLAFAAGDGVPKDPGRARILLTQACGADSGPGCFELARATPAGSAANDLYVKSCDLGHALACGEAARLLYNLDQPSPRLVRMARQGCDADDPNACLVLGVLFANGIEVPLDMEEARRKLLQACSKGLEPACGLIEAL